MDMTWIGAGQAAVATVIDQPAQWRRWWPDLELAVAERRGDKGIRWTVRGQVAGSMEIYLRPADGGVVAYYFLRLDGVRRPIPRHRRAALVRAYRARAKRVLWAVGDHVDPGRLARVAAPD